MTTKSEIRKEMINLRKGLDGEFVKEQSEIITKKVLSSAVYKDSKSIFIYMDFANEVKTGNIITHALSMGKKIYIPKITENGQMQAVEYKWERLDKDKYGINTVLDGQACDKNSIDLAIIPVVAVDRNGGRIGFGAGYYDMFLNGTNMYRMAVCYNFQIVEDCFCNEYDQRMDAIIQN